MKIKTLSAVMFFVFLFVCAANMQVEARSRSRTNFNINFGSVLAPCPPVVYQGYAVETYRPYYSSAVVVPPAYPVAYPVAYPQAYYQVPGACYRPAPVVVYQQPPVYTGVGFSWSSRR
jgi:hypothetical protein